MKSLDISRSLACQLLLVASDNPSILGRCKSCKMENRFSLHQLKAAGDLETVGKLHVCDSIGTFLLKYTDGMRNLSFSRDPQSSEHASPREGQCLWFC